MGFLGLNLGGKKKGKQVNYQNNRFQWSLTKKEKIEMEGERKKVTMFIHVSMY